MHDQILKTDLEGDILEVALLHPKVLETVIQ